VVAGGRATTALVHRTPRLRERNSRSSDGLATAVAREEARDASSRWAAARSRCRQRSAPAYSHSADRWSSSTGAGYDDLFDLLDARGGEDRLRNQALKPDMILRSLRLG
jgi:hypothetical protein